MHILQLRIAKSRKTLTLDQLIEFSKEKILNVNALPSRREYAILRDLWKGVDCEDSFTSFLGSQGTYLVVHQELISYLLKTIQSLEGLNGKPVLEVCAGNGKLSYHLQQKGAQSIAIDNHTWPTVKKSLRVEDIDADLAIRKYGPELVIASYIPADTDVPLEILQSPSVKYFIHLGNAEDFLFRDSFRKKLSEMGNIETRKLKIQKINYKLLEEFPIGHNILYVIK